MAGWHPDPSTLDPERYAAGKLPLLLSRWRDARIREAAERWGRSWLTSIEPTLALASGCTSTGPGERGGPPDYATGLYGVELQRARLWWNDATTREDLGRSTANPDNAAAFAADIDGQTYLGFRSYAGHLGVVARSLPENVRPPAMRGEGALPVGSWGWRLAVSGYSSGPGVISRLVTAAAPELAGVQATQRWKALARIVRDRAGTGDPALGNVAPWGRWKGAHTVLRCEQRFACAIALARALDRTYEVQAWSEQRIPAELAHELAVIAVR